MKTTSRTIVAPLLLVIGLLLASPPAGWAASDKAKARVLFREGNELFNRKQFEAALAKFRAARELFPSYKIDLNIGSTLYALERYEEAAEYYDTFLRKGLEAAPPDILKAAREKLDEVKTKVAMVTVTAAVDGARVEINAREIGHTPLPHKLYVKTGPCQISVTKAGREPFLVTLSLAPGEARTVEAVLKPKVVAPEPAQPEAPVRPAASAEPPPPEEPARPGSWKKISGWIALGVGAAGLVSGAIFGGLMASASADYTAEQKKPYALQDLGPIEDDHARYKTLTVVGLVAGGVVAAAGGGLLLWYYLGDGKRGDVERAAFVVPYFGDSGGGIAAGARF